MKIFKNFGKLNKRFTIENTDQVEIAIMTDFETRNIWQYKSPQLEYEYGFEEYLVKEITEQFIKSDQVYLAHMMLKNPELQKPFHVLDVKQLTPLMVNDKRFSRLVVLFRNSDVKQPSKNPMIDEWSEANIVQFLLSIDPAGYEILYDDYLGLITAICLLADKTPDYIYKRLNLKTNLN